jgi:hypothetical protein
MLMSVFMLIFAFAASACVPDVAGLFAGMEKSGTTADGLDYDETDILFFDILNGATNWITAFDGEWFGLKDGKHDLSAFSFNELIFSVGLGPNASEQELYLSFESNRARVPGIPGWVYGQDIVKLTATLPATPPVDPSDYQFEMFFDGSDVDLTTMSEKVDGISVWPPEYYDLLALDVDLPYDCTEAVIFLSTRGPYRVSRENVDGDTLRGDGSDVLAFCATNLGDDTAGYWFRAFDGSDAGIEPPNAAYSLDVWAIGNIGPLSDSGDLDLDIFFFFTTRDDFEAHDGAVEGDISDLFVGGALDGSDGVEFTGFNYNAGIDVPALNGVVENAGVLDILLTTP